MMHEKPSRCRTLSLLAALAISLTQPAASAETTTPTDYTALSLEELMAIDIPSVTSASKHVQKITEAPSSVSIVTADEISRYGWRNLGELLRSVRGFYVSDDRAYGYVGSRGVNRTRDFGGRLLLLIDGHRLNDPVYGTFANRQDFLLDLDLVERVEIVRGPGSALYGDNAFFGVVNVVTRSGKAVNGTEIAASAGSFDTATGRLTYGGQSASGVEVLLSGSLSDSRGNDDLFFAEFDDPATSNGHVRHMDDEQAGSLYGRVGYKGLSLTGGYVNREKQVPTARYDSVFGDPRFEAWDRRLFAEAVFSHTLPSRWEVQLRGTYDRYVYEAGYPYLEEDGFTGLNREETDVQWVGADIQARRLLAEQHLVTIGAEYRAIFSVDQRTYNEDPYELIFASDPDFANGGLFLQDEFRLGSAFILNIGLRLDSYDTFGETLNPRVGLIYTPWTATTFKLLYGTAFRAPNVNEMYYQNGDDIRDVNPGIDPEEIATYEAIWEQRFGSWVRTSLAAFHNEVDGIIEFSPEADLVNTFFFVNAGDATVDGAEFEIEAGQRTGLRGRASYAYAEVDHKDRMPFDNSPEHLVKLNLLVPLGSERYTASLEAQYTSRRLVDEGGEVDSFWLANATLFAQPLGDRLDLSLGVYNLFDEAYDDPAYGVPIRVPQDGRTFRVKATYRF